MKLKDALQAGYSLVEFQGYKVESVFVDNQYRVIRIAVEDRSGYLYLGEDIEVRDIEDEIKLIMQVKYDEDLVAALQVSDIAPVQSSHIIKQPLPSKSRNRSSRRNKDSISMLDDNQAVRINTNLF